MTPESAVAALVAISLVAFTAAHLMLLGSLLMRPPRCRALLALAVPPLAPYWAWRGGLKARVYAWGAALALYTTGVAVLTR